jgi:hypothetical protein
MLKNIIHLALAIIIVVVVVVVIDSDTRYPKRITHRAAKPPSAQRIKLAIAIRYRYRFRKFHLTMLKNIIHLTFAILILIVIVVDSDTKPASRNTISRKVAKPQINNQRDHKDHREIFFSSEHLRAEICSSHVGQSFWQSFNLGFIHRIE